MVSFLVVLLHRQKSEKMKPRIIYVGTLIDLAAMFEPDIEAESIEVTNILNYGYYEQDQNYER